ncbi:hypothetical protein GIB67_000258 [Kingdonia uniflora]|uniref:Small auxin up regulated protein n=1 Tax=Kingdonia uniflora TaxID=39325 RepID=A0A7J7LCE5_9MAGN|nr:hypothetical protein GIB67_000258 [Kingdonia uniflora]
MVKRSGLLMFKKMTEKLQRNISMYKRLPRVEDEATVVLPEDVKEGHFVVIAVNGGEQTRFVVELSYLNNPDFLRLLEKAKEEFGFKQNGILAVPCRPDELQRILGRKRKDSKRNSRKTL